VSSGKVDTNVIKKIQSIIRLICTAGDKAYKFFNNEGKERLIIRCFDDHGIAREIAIKREVKKTTRKKKEEIAKSSLRSNSTRGNTRVKITTRFDRKDKQMYREVSGQHINQPSEKDNEIITKERHESKTTENTKRLRADIEEDPPTGRRFLAIKGKRINRRISDSDDQSLERHNEDLADKQHRGEETRNNKRPRQDDGKEIEFSAGIRPQKNEVKKIAEKYEPRTCSKILNIQILTDHDETFDIKRDQNIDEHREDPPLPKPSDLRKTQRTGQRMKEITKTTV
jgi:hypothetical protein